MIFKQTHKLPIEIKSSSSLVVLLLSIASGIFLFNALIKKK
jgi:hypothetical protein